MATNMDKSLYSAPQGLDALNQEPDLEIEIENPDSVGIHMDGLEIQLEPDKEDIHDDFNDNLAEYMDDRELATLASELIGDYEDDLSSRKDWIQTYVDGLDLLGMKIEERTEPWAGACGIVHPLMSEALVKFQSETIMETFPAAGPVKISIIGKETPEKTEAAERVRDDMNYQLTDKMVEYRPEHERMLWGLGLSGNAFKKVYFDPGLNRQVSIFVPAEDIVVPYGASSLETAERITHVMRKTKNELRRLQVSSFYCDVDMDDPSDALDEVEKKIAEKMGFRATTDNRYKILEMHVDLDLAGFEDKDKQGEETGIALPYVFTIEKGTNTILAIRRNWNKDEEEAMDVEPDVTLKTKRMHFVHYGYIPGFGFYHFGLIHLIGAFAKSGTSIIRQLVDAGTLANLPGGMKSKGLRIKGDDTPIAPGEFRDVDVASGSIRDNILPLPYKEPSQVLMALLNQIIDEGRRFAGASDLQVSDMSANAPVGTTLAILERTLKVMSAVQARIHYSMRQEFKLLKTIIRDYTPTSYDYDPVEGNRRVKQSDYDLVEVIPVSDPNAATMSQKVVQYQAVMQMAQMAPQIYDLPELHKQMLEVLGIKNIGKLIPTEADEKPRDPVFENMAVLNMKPVKAFMYQDHESHIIVHTAAMQDPKIMQLMGQNPQAPMIQAAMMAHLNEHIAFAYRQKLEEQIGVPLPYTEKDDAPMEKDMEIQVSRLAAAGAQKLLAANQGEAAQQQAQQTAEDPLVQMQQKELEIMQAEQKRKVTKDQMDAAAKADQLELEKLRIESQREIAGLQVGAKSAKDKAELEARNEAEGVRLGSQIAKDHATLRLQHAQLNSQTPKKGE
jgi:hypothetical protein